jgi:hypothetical protein
MHTFKVRVYFAHTVSDVYITATTLQEAHRIAMAQYSGQRIGNIARVG